VTRSAAIMLLCAAIAWAGCPPTPGPADPRGRTDAGGPKAPRILRYELIVTIPRDVPDTESLPLPPFPSFRDPFGLPDRSLERERRLAYNRKGRRRLISQTHLAARLWKLANRKIDRIRRLKARVHRAGRRPAQRRIHQLRREASAHLKECVTLLEGVLEAPSPPRAARVRLAHYLRGIEPARAIPHFRRLLRGAPPPGRRRRYARDLAQLLLSTGRPAEALRLLTSRAVSRPVLRTRLIRLAARLGVERQPLPLGEDARELVRRCDRAPPMLRSVILRLVPRLAARLEEPQRLLVELSRRAPDCRQRLGDGLVEQVIRRLMLRGRPTRAAAVLQQARGRGAAVSSGLAKRVQRTGGPWSVRAQPPAAPRFRRLVQARAASLTPCLRPAPAGSARLRVRVGPGGGARLTGDRAAPSAPPKGSPNKGERARASGSRLHTGCAQAVIRSWRFPPWRSTPVVLLELRPFASPSRTVRRRSPPRGRR
jgi:hypothetical protein